MKKFFQEIIASVFSDIPNKHAIWLEALSDQDDLNALHAAIQGLELALSDKTLPPDNLTKIIDRVEQKTAPILTKLGQQFIRFEFMNSNLENNILAVVYAYHKQLYNAYILLLENFLDTPNLQKIESACPLMHGAVDHAFEMLKWRSFVNFGLVPNVWLQLHKIFTVAAENNLLANSREVAETDAEDQVDNNTLGARLIQTYMLDNLQQANLNPQGVDIACKLLKSQLLNVDISNEFNPIKFLFYVDLGKDTGAKRIRYFTPTNTCIYWHIDELEKTIRYAVNKKSNLSLDDLFPIEPHQTKAAIEALGMVLREWSRKEYLRQRRKENRQKLTTTANVVHGIQEVIKRVQSHQDSKLNFSVRLSADGKILDERLRSHTTIKGAPNTPNLDNSDHHWVVVDESNQGLGAVASRELNAWITVGQLVGLVLADDKQDMIIAVIKSTRPKAHRQIHVGLELLSRHAKWVQLKIVTYNMNRTEDTTTANTHSFTGLYLPIEAGLSLSSMLLLPKIEFIPHAQYEVSIFGMVERINLNEAIDSKDDWVKVVYPR